MNGGTRKRVMTRPEKVLAACEALMPHLYNVARTTADPDKNVPIGYWMHRGCVPLSWNRRVKAVTPV